LLQAIGGQQKQSVSTGTQFPYVAAPVGTQQTPKIKFLISNQISNVPHIRTVMVKFHHEGGIESLNRIWSYRDRNLNYLPDNTFIEFWPPDGRVTSLPAFETQNLLEFCKKFHIENVGYCCGSFVNDIWFGRGLINPRMSDGFISGESVITEAVMSEDTLLPGDGVFSGAKTRHHP
jgi:hypothetical protein